MRIVTDDHAIDGDALHARVDRAAGAFAMGVSAGDRVAVLMRNDIPFFEASLACRRLGAYCVAVNWHLAPDEVRYILDDCRASLLIAHADLLAPLARPLPCPAIAVAIPPAIRAAYRVTTDGHDETADWEALLADAQPWTQPSPAATETLIYTSGTSGHPKGVLRRPPTPDQAAASERMRAHIFGIGPGARACVPAPLYHMAPNLFGHRAVVQGELLVLPSRFDPAALLATIERHRVTHLYAVPAMFARLLALPTETRAAHDLSSLRVVLHAGGPCAPSLKAAMIDWLGPVVEEYYGSTEAGPLTHVDSAEWLAHPGTVGRALPGIVLRIAGDDGRPLPIGEVGEVQAINPAYPDFTYLNRPGDRGALEQDGLLASGDLGYLDADGRLFLCDRKRDLVISGGVNIYPAEIEAALHTLPGVADCVVFGVPDEINGEALLAIVEPEQGAELSPDTLRATLRNRIAAYKVPQTIELRDALPREETGKIRKRLLRDAYWANAGRHI